MYASKRLLLLKDETMTTVTTKHEANCIRHSTLSIIRRSTRNRKKLLYIENNGKIE